MVIIGGIVDGMKSVWVLVIVVCVGMLGVFVLVVKGQFGYVELFLLGFYGVGIVVVGMLSIFGIMLVIDVYGLIVDNVGGNVEMVGFELEVCE